MLLRTGLATRVPSLCPRCGSKALREGPTSMIAIHIPAFSDDQGRHHLHDGNAAIRELTCIPCNFAFAVKEYRACWCGWTSS